MIVRLESSIVRIRTAGDGIVGAGFLVSARQVLTCAHIVAGVLGLPDSTREMPQAMVHLDFPLVEPEYILTARVILWQPESDVAGLELDGDPPAGVQPVQLVTAKDLWLHAFRVLGFPAGYEDGVWASGVLRGRTAAGWVQIEDVKETGYWVQPGFSGTPVWDEQLNGVVGIVVAADTHREVKAAFMVPADLLIKAWPQLGERGVDAGSLEYLQAQLAVFEAAQRDASDPRRFQSRIDELQAAIAHWGERVEDQRQRIADGLEAQRQQTLGRGTQRHDGVRLRVVGRRPLDVADYFKDRERELVTIGQLLAEPTARLVSIIGRGGMGKTALVCKVLRDLECHRWPYTDDDIPLDGIVYLSTRTAGISLERLFLDCAKMLGGEQEGRLNSIWTNPQIGAKDKISYLLEALSNGRYVILLDNIEDLIDDVGQLTDENLRLFFEHSLTTSHGARLLVTSRVALAFGREVMRFDRQVKLLEGLPMADGVAMLRELDPNGDRGLRDAPEEQLIRAVSLVHGVPRALEVLAGILANDPFASLADVLERFYQYEDVVHALIEENYRRLDASARRVIEALAVFRCPVPPLAVDYLLEPFACGLDVPGIIRRLTRTNIVSVDRATKAVMLHPIDQDYAYSQLPKEEDSESAHTWQALERRAADYYAQLRTPPETWKSIDDLEPQLNEFEHRVRAGDCDDAYRVLEMVDSDYLYMWGHYTRLVEMREKLLGHLTDPTLRAANLGSLGHACYSLGNVDRAVGLYEQARTVGRELGNPRWEGEILGKLARAYHVLGQIEQAIKLYTEALAIARKSPVRDSRQEGILLGNLGLAHHHLAQIGQAAGLYEMALAIAWKNNDHKQKGLQLGRLGITYLDLGRVEQAVRFFERALGIAREIGDRRYEGAWLSYLGSAYHIQGKTEQAIASFEQGLTIVSEIGDRRGEGTHLSRYGLFYHALGQAEQAIKLHRRALDFKIEDLRERSYQLLRLGQALLAVGKLSEAGRYCREALELDVPGTSYQAALMLGVTLLQQHDIATEATFADAVVRSRALLNKTVGLHEPRYALAAALAGIASCNSRWAEENERAALLAPVLAEYRRALETCAVPGVVRNALRDLEMIRAAGIEGLEPVFELLQLPRKI